MLARERWSSLVRQSQVIGAALVWIVGCSAEDDPSDVRARGGDAGSALNSPSMPEARDGGDASSQDVDHDGGSSIEETSSAEADAGEVVRAAPDAGASSERANVDASVDPERDPPPVEQDAGLGSNTERDAGRRPTLPVDDDPVPDAGLEPAFGPDAGAFEEPVLDAAVPLSELDASAPELVVDAGSLELHGTPQTHPLDAYQSTGSAIELPGISSNASDITWKRETDTFFVVVNGTGQVHEYSANFGTRLRTVSLTGASTDTEGLTYLGDDRFAAVVEDNELFIFSLAEDQTAVNLSQAPVQRYIVTAPPTTANRGFEGVAFAPSATLPHRFFVCQEGGYPATPMRILQLDERTTGTVFSYETDLVVDEPWSAVNELGTVVTDLAGLHYDEAASTLLVLSQESSTIVRVAPSSGEILEQRVLSRSPQYEGVTLADDDRLVLVSEPNLVEVLQAPELSP